MSVEGLIEQVYRERYPGFRNALAPIVGSRKVAHDVVQEAWNDVVARVGTRRPIRHRARLALVAALVLIAIALPTLALSASVRELLGLSHPGPDYKHARLAVSAPIPGGRVARVWVSPSTDGGRCQFVTIDPAASSTRTGSASSHNCTGIASRTAAARSTSGAARPADQTLVPAITPNPGRVASPLSRITAQSHHRQGHRELVPAGARESVPIALPPDVAASFQATEHGEERAVAGPASQRGRVWVSRHQPQQAGLGHTAR
jgi:hypothetical protein